MRAQECNTRAEGRPIDAELHFALNTYRTKELTLRGTKRRIISSLSPQHVTTAYTWVPAENKWRTDSIALGLSRQGLQVLNEASLLVSPIQRLGLDLLIKGTLLAELTAEPSKLINMLRQHPECPVDLTKFSISTTVPIYHASGFSKHVFRCILLMLPLSSEAPCIEVNLALKLAQKPGAISSEELEYHRLMGRNQGPKRIISSLIGAYDLGQEQGLGKPGQVLSVETFEPGQTAGFFMDSRTHLSVAQAVSRCAFSMIDCAMQAVAKSTVRSTVGKTPLDQAPLFSVRFPSDINPGNFIIGSRGYAVFVDPGRFQPSHTFSEIMLRLINSFWNHKQKTADSREIMLPLAPLFNCVEDHFGKTAGSRLLKEFCCTIGFFIGTPLARLGQLLPECPVRKIGDGLAKLYVGSSEHSGQYISNAIRNRKNEFWAELRNASDPDDEDTIAKLQRSHAIPYYFNDHQLKNIFGEIKTYLALTSSVERDTASKFNYLRRANRLSSKTNERRIGRRSLTFMGMRALPRPGTGRGLVLHAYRFTPFPEPAFVRLGISTIGLLTKGGKKSETNTRHWNQFREKLLSTCGILHRMFEDRSLASGIADVVSRIPADNFYAEARRLTKLGKGRGKDFQALVEKWVYLAVALGTTSAKDKALGLQMVAINEAGWRRALPRIFKCVPADIPNILAEEFPAEFGHSKNKPDSGAVVRLGDEVSRAIETGAQSIFEILIRRSHLGPLKPLTSFRFPERRPE